eukprot:jgi/Orpsp1_1/1175275/evm.model.c7180000053261.1
MKLLKAIILISLSVLVSSKPAEEENVESVLKFNLESGFYNDKTIELEIKSNDPKAIIYYTLDGSIPTENSTVYENPFTLKNRSEEKNVLSSIIDVAPKNTYSPCVNVTKANVIRAIAKLPDGSLTNVVSGTYFVGLNRKKLYGDLPVVSLITDPDNLFDYEKGIYVMGKRYDDWIAADPANAKAEKYLIQGNYNNKGKESERPVTMEYFPTNENNAAFSHDLGIRIKGKATRTYVQKSFHMTSREEYGKKNLKYELIPGNERSDGKGIITKYKSFNLRNGGNDSDFALIRDNVLQSLIKNPYFETQQSSMVIVFIDGEYWGIYNIIEEYSDNYISNNYDIDNKNVAIIKGKVVESGDDSDLTAFNEVMHGIRDTDMSVPANYVEASKQIDMACFAWYSAFCAYIDVKDGWTRGGNWAMWHVKAPDSSVAKADGKWRIMAYDTEFSSGLYGDGTDYNADVLGEAFDKKSSSSKNLGSYVMSSLVENPEFKNMFVNALCDVRNIKFETKKSDKIIDRLVSIYAPLVKDHYERFGPEYIVVEEPEPFFKNQIRILKSWLKGRRSVFLDIIAKNFGFKPAVKVSVTSNDFKKGGFVVNDGWEVMNETYTGEYFRENILYITAKPVQGKKLKSWKITKCKLASNNKLTIGVYPKKGCKITADFK